MALGALALVAGCTSGSDSTDDIGYREPSEVEGDWSEDGDSVSDSAAAPEAVVGSDGQVTPVVADTRQVITTGEVEVVVDDPIAASGEAVSIVAAAGGRIEAREEYDGGGDPYASLVLRIAPDRLDQLIEDLGALGERHGVNTWTDDVTLVVQDLDARIRALETSVARLEDLLSTAGDVSDLLDVEMELSNRQADLESLQSRRAALAEDVAMSTLTVSFTTIEPEIEPTEQSRFAELVSDAWNTVVDSVSGIVIIVAALAPWALVLGVIAFLVLRVVRRRRETAPGTEDQGGDGHPGDPVQERSE